MGVEVGVKVTFGGGAHGGPGGAWGGKRGVLPLVVFADGRTHAAPGGQLPKEPPTAPFDIQLHHSPPRV